jgi:hypothetical protein
MAALTEGYWQRQTRQKGKSANSRADKPELSEVDLPVVQSNGAPSLPRTAPSRAPDTSIPKGKRSATTISPATHRL